MAKAASPHFHHQFHAGLRSPVGQASAGRIHEPIHRQVLDVAVDPAAFQPGVGQDVFHEVTQPRGLDAERVEVVLLLGHVGDHPLAEHFRVHVERGQGRAELVGHGGDEGGPPLAQADHAAKSEATAAAAVKKQPQATPSGSHTGEAAFSKPPASEPGHQPHGQGGQPARLAVLARVQNGLQLRLRQEVVA